MLLSAITVLGLSGCEQAEQAVNSTVEKAKQGAGGLLGQTEESKPQDSNENGDAENPQDDETSEQTAEDKGQDD